MTFSLIGRCSHTGQFGAAVSTSLIAVGSRVAFCAARVGAVLTQHRTDPRLGPRGLDLLRSGCSAPEFWFASRRWTLVCGGPLVRIFYSCDRLSQYNRCNRLISLPPAIWR